MSSATPSSEDVVKILDRCSMINSLYIRKHEELINVYRMYRQLLQQSEELQFASQALSRSKSELIESMRNDLKSCDVDVKKYNKEISTIKELQDMEEQQANVLARTHGNQQVTLEYGPERKVPIQVPRSELQ